MFRQGLNGHLQVHTAPFWLSTLVAAGLLTTNPDISRASVQEDAPPPASHVRPLDRCGARLLEEALARSAIVREMTMQLAESDVVVYVTSVLPLTRVEGMPRGKTRFLSANPAARFLQVWVDPARGATERIAVLAHELQHALEVAGAPDVRDLEGLGLLYEELGTASPTAGAGWGVRRYETAAALAVEARVRAELLQASTPDGQAGAR